ncbi:MAG: Holliday junction resolvase RuvX [Planctomycetota bacterium]
MKIWAGVDPGEKRIGVARSDPLGITGQPVAILSSPEELVKLLQEWQEGHELAGVVVGLPRNMDGSYGPMAQRSAKLVNYLREEISVGVWLWDERLTTRHLIGLRGGKRHHERVDDQVAALLLQSFLDAGAPQRPDPPELTS